MKISRLTLVLCDIEMKQFQSALTIFLFCLPFFIGGINSIELRAGLVFLSVLYLWLSEQIPLPMTGILVPCYGVASGILAANEAFSSFGDPVLFLFIGSFILAQGMIKQGLDQTLANRLMGPLRHSPQIWKKLAAFSGVSWVLGMWISNSAATAMLLPIAYGLFHSISAQANESSKPLHPFLFRRVLLTTAFSASIGGIATPIGSPPNAIALSFLTRSNIEITFLQWVFYCLPLSFAMLIAMNLILSLMLPVFQSKKNVPVDLESSSKISLQFSTINEASSTRENRLKVLAIFCLTILLWIGPSFLSLIFVNETWTQDLQRHLPMGVVAVIAASLLFIVPGSKIDENQRSLISWQDAKKIDWGTVMLFGGGLCLSKILETSGLSNKIGHLLFNASGSDILLFAALLIICCIIFSEFSSNTASAAIMIPVVATVVENPSQLRGLILTAAIASSFGFMLPVSTPPNAIVFGTGHIPLRFMMRAGVAFDFLGAIFILIWFTGLAGLYQ